MPDQDSNAQAAVKPTGPGERIDLVDVLRGFAVFGILVVNMSSFSGMDGGLAPWTQPLDRAIYLLTRFLFEAKFYSLFSFLFGWGMAVQMRRAAQRESNFLPRYLRRLLALLLFGIIHGTLIWTGDILTYYAMLGFLLLLFRKRSVRFLLGMSAASLLLAIFLVLPWNPVQSFREWYFDLTSPLLLNRFGNQLYADGTFLEITRLRIQDFLSGQVYTFFAFGNVFAMFALGLAAGKARVFSELEATLPRLRRILPLLVVSGVLLNGLFVYVIMRPGAFAGDTQYAIRVGARTIGAPLLTLSYLIGIAMLYQIPDWRRRLSALAPVGRMALSNYIFQSLVLTLVFYHYGLGMYGRADPTGALLLTILVYIVQLRLSAWWLERFRFGPLEWFWRLLTYGEPQTLRRRYPFETVPRDALTTDPARGRRLAATVVSGALLLWGTGLIIWGRSIERDRVDPQAFHEAIRPVEIESQDSDEVNSKPQQGADPTTSLLDAFQPVERSPSPLAASGDLSALAEAFDTGQALAEIETLAGRAFAGRLAGSEGGFAAGDYLANRFKTLGLLPAGEDGTYFQSFVIPYTTLADVPQLAVTNSEHERPQSFHLNRDFSVISRNYSGEGDVEAPVVWVDSCSREDFTAIQVLDAIAFCRAATNVDAGRNALEFGALGLLLIDGDGRPLDFARPRFPALVSVPIPTMGVSPAVAEALLAGSSIAWQDLELGSPPQLLASRALLHIAMDGSEACSLRGCQGRNVLAWLPGRDPRYADQVVIVSAHYDHMGSTPDGTIWWGANDDASGVAVLLEIARVWQEQGYVPRRSVLFAAWDAEELGLLGSQAFVRNPTVPRSSIYTDLQMDMVGAGGNLLEISGSGHLVPILEGVAAGYGLETIRTEGGGSDHASFLQAGMEAALLIWQGQEDLYQDYHRPLDNPGRIDLGLLESAGRVAHLSLLSVVEGIPAFQDLLDRRAAALLEGDLQGFLSTGDPEQRDIEHTWFESARQAQLSGAKLDLSSLILHGDQARGTVQVELTYPIEGETERMQKVSEGLAVQFRRVDGSWRWMGPDLIEEPLQSDAGELPSVADVMGVHIYKPADMQFEDLGWIESALEELRAAGSRLGMHVPRGLKIEFFSNSRDMRMFSDPGTDQLSTTWMSPGVLRLVTSSNESSPDQLTQALLRWLLYTNGVQVDQAEWLWNGLLLAMQTEDAPDVYQPDLLPDLYWSLEAGEQPESETAAWAAVEYLHQRIGWGGVGRVIQMLGTRCQASDCSVPQELESAYSAALGMGKGEFELSWTNYWLSRLQGIVDGLQATLRKRVQAASAGSINEFLGTVDPLVRGLLVDQRAYFQRLSDSNPAELSWGVEVQVIYRDGRVLARVGQSNAESGSELRPTSNWSRVLFKPSASGFRWADYPLEILDRGGVAVLYPPGSEDLAAGFLDLIDSGQAGVSQVLGFPSRISFTLKVYPDEPSLRNSIPIGPTVQLPLVWSDQEGSFKIALDEGDLLDEAQTRAEITRALIRRLLVEAGIEQEWLLRGLSSYLVPELDQRQRMFAASRYLNRIESAAHHETLPPLTSMQTDHQLEPEQIELADAQAWDAVRMLFDVYGDDVLGRILRDIRTGASFEAAFESATGLTEGGFNALWLDSTLNGSLTAAQVSLANGFDQERAMDHVSELSGTATTGREVGTQGGRVAAEYIRDEFERVGLQPIVPVLQDEGLSAELDGTTLEENESAEDTHGPDFYQTFDVYRVPFERAPSLQITQTGTGEIFSFRYRHDFRSILQAYEYQGPIAGEMIWARDADSYLDLDLSGKIILRFEPGTAQEEVQQALEHGAIGLILVTDDQALEPFLAKTASPLGEPVAAGIPIFEISQGAYHELMRAAGYTPVSLQEGPSVVRLGMQAELDLPTLPAAQGVGRNVFGFVPGSDPDLADEVIILGAHYDHVGNDPDAWRCEPGMTPLEETIRLGLCHLEVGLRYSGANDDASGVAALLEIARLWQASGYRPARSVLFAAWDAQEAGQVGSQYYLAHPLFPVEKTMAMIQLDAIGGGRGYYLEVHGTSEHDGMLLGLASLIEDQAAARLSLVRESIQGRSDPSSRALPWLSTTISAPDLESDHLSFRQLGIPSVLLTWRGSNENNEPDGEADSVLPDRLGMAGRMAALLTMSLAH